MNKLFIIFISMLFCIYAQATNHNIYSPQRSLDKLVKADAQAIIINGVEGRTAVLGFGHNEDIDSADAPETVWAKGGLYAFPAAAGVTTVVSSSASDVSTATGAFGIRVTGLDADWAAITEDIALTGTTIATLTNQFLRVNQAGILTSGTNGTNVGNLTLQVGGADVQYIGAGAGVDHSMWYSVPAGKTFYLLEQYATVQKIGAATGVVIHAKYKPFGGSWLIGRHIDFNSLGSTNFQDVLSVPFTIAEKSDFIMEVASTTGDDVAVTGGFRGILKDN